MSVLISLSFGLNLLIFAATIYLVINGKKHISNYFLTNVIDKRHQQKLSMFTECERTKNAIIFFGDSITEGGNWAELFNDKLVLNRGIGGDVTTGLLKRVGEVIRHQPAKVFICIGTNDIARGLDTAPIIENYKTLIKSIQKESSNTKIYIQSVLPVGKRVLFGHDNEKVIVLNQEVKKMCTTLNVPYIDLYPIFIDEAGYLNPAFTNDNLHIMGNAYLLWKEKISPYVYE